MSYYSDDSFDHPQLHENEMTFKYEETLCPDCNGPMISRTGKFGVFWGCKKFPECKGTRDSSGKSKKDRAREKGEEVEELDNSIGDSWDKNTATDKISFTKNYGGEKFSFRKKL